MRGCRLGCAAGALMALTTAAVGQTDVYRLNAGSFYELGCHGACECPILVHSALTGTFQLTRLAPDPLFARYAISDVQWAAGERDISGNGTYRVGGEVAVQQQMVLDLLVAGTAK